MPPRVVFLKLMLWSLALAAAAGVWAVLSLKSSVAWQVVGTGIATSVACALLLPISAMVDREKTRPAGLAGMIAILLEFLLALLIIWNIPRLFPALNLEEALAVTMGFTVLAGPVFMFLLTGRHLSSAATASNVGLLVATASYGLCMIGAWLNLDARAYPYSDERWFATGGSVLTCGGLGSIALVGLAARDRRWWRWLGVLSSVGAGVLWIGGIWKGTTDPIGFVIFESLLSVAVLVGHANLSLLVPLRAAQGWLRGGTILAVALTAGLIVTVDALGRLSGVYRYDLPGRLAAAAGIAAACGTVALLVLARLNRRIDLEPLSTQASQVTLHCPRCSKRQLVNLGGAVCQRCGLRIFVRIEEPRCPQCDYLLFGLSSDRCPECGTVITTERPLDPTPG